MILRAFLAIAVVAVLAAGPAHADVFRCGKAFITFAAIEKHAGVEGITVRKVDVIGLAGPNSSNGKPAQIITKPFTAGADLGSYKLSRETHQRIVECLN